MRTERLRAWKRLIQKWRKGPALQIEHARVYTRQYPEDFGGWIVLADGLWGVARYSEARSALHKAQSMAPPEVRHGICEQWGHFYAAKSDLRRAEAWYRKAARLKPTTGAHICLGAVVAKQGRLEEAMRLHRRAIRLRTAGHAVDEAHYNVGLILRAQGRYRAAAASFKKALSIDPHYTLAREAWQDVKRAAEDSGMLANKRMQLTRSALANGRRGPRS